MASHVLDVAPKATVLGLRAIREDEDPKKKAADAAFGAAPTGSRDPVAEAIYTALDAHVGVISLSLGNADLALFKFSQPQATAIATAVSKGVVVVAAAGNEGDGSNGIAYPANYPGVIAVGASAPSGKRAAFSQVHSYVDLLTPGQEVTAADSRTGGRSKTQGTSSATALTSGVAALIKSAYPELAPRQVEEALVRSASHYKKGHDPETGYGRISAAAALTEAARLKPEPAQIAAARHGGPNHLGPGDDGTPPWNEQGLNPTDQTIGGVAAGMGLIGIVVGVLLFRSGRRAARSSTMLRPARRRPRRECRRVCRECRRVCRECPRLRWPCRRAARRHRPADVRRSSPSARDRCSSRRPGGPLSGPDCPPTVRTRLPSGRSTGARCRTIRRPAVAAAPEENGSVVVAFLGLLGRPLLLRPRTGRDPPRGRRPGSAGGSRPPRS